MGVERLLQRLPGVLRQPAGLPSPCQSVCQMHEPLGWCRGCLRTLPEIASWGSLAEAQKRDIWQQLERRAQVMQSSPDPAHGIQWHPDISRPPKS